MHFRYLENERLQLWFINPNYCAAFLCMALLLGIGLFCVLRAKRDNLFLLIPFAIKTNNYLYFITYITIPLVFDLYRMLKMYNQDRTSIPTIRFWHNPLENWDKIKNTYNAPFYLRFFYFVYLI